MNSFYVFNSHLREIKYRLSYLFIGLLINFTICYNNVYHIVYGLSKDFTDIIVYTNLTESFFTHINLSFTLSIIFTIPLVYFHVYYFLKPGLYINEVIFLRKILLNSFISYISFLAIATFLLYPIALSFFTSYQYDNITPEFKILLLPRIQNIVSFYKTLILIFSIISQTPVFLYIMVHYQLINIYNIIRMRKLSILVSFILGAIFSPPDLLSQLIIAISLILLYELTVFYTIYQEWKLRSSGVSIFYSA